MPTFDNRALVDNLMAHEGYIDGMSDNSLGDNPRVVKIFEYTNAWGRTAWGCLLETDRPDYYSASDFVRSPRVIWEYRA